MTRPFPVSIKPRSEAKRKWILENCTDAGITVKTADQPKTSKWDVFYEADGQYTWQGVTSPYVRPEKPRVYPEGV